MTAKKTLSPIQIEELQLRKQALVSILAGVEIIARLDNSEIVEKAIATSMELSIPDHAGITLAEEALEDAVNAETDVFKIQLKFVEDSLLKFAPVE